MGSHERARGAAGELAGELPHPPLHFLTGVRPIEVTSGEAVFALPCHEWLCSPLGTIEGGTIAMLADSALASAIQTTAPPGAAVAAIDLKVNFLRPVHPDGRDLLAHGRVRHAGRTIAIAEAEVVNADGKAGRPRDRLGDDPARPPGRARRRDPRLNGANHPAAGEQTKSITEKSGFERPRRVRAGVRSRMSSTV